MAASEYLSKKSETGARNPVKSAVYTGIAYVFTVFLLILPFLLLNDYRLCLAWTLAHAVLIILVFNYYVSVARDLPFRERFWEMVIVSLGVAAVSFGIGVLIRLWRGVEVCRPGGRRVPGRAGVGDLQRDAAPSLQQAGVAVVDLPDLQGVDENPAQAVPYAPGRSARCGVGSGICACGSSSESAASPGLQQVGHLRAHHQHARFPEHRLDRLQSSEQEPSEIPNHVRLAVYRQSRTQATGGRRKHPVWLRRRPKLR